MSRGLLEREKELAQIGRLVDAALVGSGGALIIEGEPGIGKTSLLDRACDAGAVAGYRVLRARGAVFEEQFAFGVVRQLFEGMLARASDSERQEYLGGAAGLAGAMLGIATNRQPGPIGDTTFATLHGLYWLCFNVAAAEPLLLAVDDAHWADAASLRFLNFLASRLEGLRMVVAVALRTEERGELLEYLMTRAGAELVRPSPLSEHGCEELLEAVFDGAEATFCRACFQATGGNPFYLHALADGLMSDRIAPDESNAGLVAAQAPATVISSVVLRLSRMPQATTMLARALAVLGADAKLGDVAALAGLDHAQAAGGADLLAAGGIITPRRPLRFVHPIVEAAIYSGLALGERDHMHAEAARLLSESGASAEQSASHLLASEPRNDPCSVEVLRAAAAGALARGAPESAVSYLERAKREGVSGELSAKVVHELGVAEFLSGRVAGLSHLSQALELTGGVRERAKIALELGNALTLADRFQHSVLVLERAIDELGAGDPALATALEAHLLGASALHLATRPAHRQHLERVHAERLGDSPEERQLLANVALWTCSTGERAAVVQALAERALAGGKLLAEVTCDSQIFHCAANTLQYSEAFDRARYWYDRALADARARGSLSGFALASAMRAECCYALGELAEAEADARAAIEAGGKQRWVLEPVANGTLAKVLLERGQLAEAKETLTQLEIRSEMDRSRLAAWLMEQPGMINWLLHAQGQLQLAELQWDAAAENLLAAGEWMTAWGEHNPGLLDWRSGAAIALARLGELDRARSLTAEVIRLGRELGQDRSLGAGLRAAALVEGGSEGIELLREAVAAFDSAGTRLDQARAQIELGAAMRRLRQRRDAREPLREGIDLAQRCGAIFLADRGHAELVATGARPRRLARHGIEALTPSERRVAQLAADRLSTREIAQQLFVTVNTVDSHLRHAYSKLDVHSRAELRRALASEEPGISDSLEAVAPGRVAAAGR